MTKKEQKKKENNNKINSISSSIFDNKNNIKILLISFLVSRLIMIIFLIINKDLSVLETYDSIHYLNMAKYGYNDPQLYAFFPLYPTLIKFLSLIIP